MQKEIFEIIGVQCPNCVYLVSGVSKCPSCDGKLKVNVVAEENKVGFFENPIVEMPDSNQLVLF